MKQLQVRVRKAKRNVVFVATLGLLIFGLLGGVAHAEVDMVYPKVYSSTGTLVGSSSYGIDWGWGTQVTFRGSVTDRSPDGFCVAAFRYVDRAYYPDAGWSRVSGSLACGSGTTDSFSDTQYHGDTRGAYVKICRVNSSGVLAGGGCGSSWYVDDGTSNY